MSIHKLNELPSVEPIESKYTLDEIRVKLSGLLGNNELLKSFDSKQAGVLALIFCLANEINTLRNKVAELENYNLKLTAIK